MDDQANSSNLQGLENEKSIPRGEANEIINFDSNKQIIPSEYELTGEIIKERSDLLRLQQEDFRLRIHGSELHEHHNDFKSTHQHQTNSLENDRVEHSHSKFGRLRLSIRYDHERSQLIIQIIDFEGIIRPEQIYALEMSLIFSLTGNDRTAPDAEKHERIIVANASVQWKEPVIFSIIYEKVIQQNLYIFVTNHTDPSAPRDREVLISLNNLKFHGEEINQWFDLQFVLSL